MKPILIPYYGTRSTKVKRDAKLERAFRKALFDLAEEGVRLSRKHKCPVSLFLPMPGDWQLHSLSLHLGWRIGDWCTWQFHKGRATFII